MASFLFVDRSTKHLNFRGPRCALEDHVLRLFNQRGLLLLDLLLKTLHDVFVTCGCFGDDEVEEDDAVSAIAYAD